MTFRAAKCPECGADIQVPSDRDGVKCMFCGKDIIVRQAIQASAGPQVRNWMKLASAAAEAGNHEEAYGYYTRVLEIEPENYEAWLGKAISAGWGSGLNSARFSELVAGIERAVEYAPDAAKDDVRKRGADVASDITVAYHKLSVEHTREYIALDDTWAEHVGRCLPMLAVFEVANRLDPTNKHVIKNGIYLAKSLIEGVEYRDPYDTDDAGTPKTKTKHLTEKLEARVKQTMDEFVAKMKALDAAYEAPEIKKAGEMGAGAAIGCLLLLVVLGAGGWFLCTKSRGEKTESPSVSVPTVKSAPVEVPVAEPVAATPDSPSLCGKPGATFPKTIPGVEWSKYACKSQDEAGALWERCVAGGLYSKKPEEWCPGDKRCCPSK